MNKIEIICMACKRTRFSAEQVCRHIIDDEDSDGDEYFFEGSDDDFGDLEAGYSTFIVLSHTRSKDFPVLYIPY